MDIIKFNIVEYISGFVVRSNSKRLNCEECWISLTKENVSSKVSLISFKIRGGLVGLQPSHDVKFVFKICENVIRLKFLGNAFVKQKNVLNITTLKVLNKCIGKDIFGNESSHFLEQDPDQNHFVFLLNAICVKYFTVRLHHFTKLYNQKIHKQKVRNHLAKTITFLGQ